MAYSKRQRPEGMESYEQFNPELSKKYDIKMQEAEGLKTPQYNLGYNPRANRYSLMDESMRLDNYGQPNQQQQQQSGGMTKEQQAGMNAATGVMMNAGNQAAMQGKDNVGTGLNAAGTGMMAVGAATGQPWVVGAGALTTGVGMLMSIRASKKAAEKAAEEEARQRKFMATQGALSEIQSGWGL